MRGLLIASGGVVLVFAGIWGGAWLYAMNPPNESPYCFASVATGAITFAGGVFAIIGGIGWFIDDMGKEEQP